MRKILAFVAALLCLGLLTSCRIGKPHLNADAFDEEFRAAHPELYLDQNCEHIFAYKDASKVSQDVDAYLYHYTYCHWGHCDYEGHFEPHAFSKSRLMGVGGAPEMRENGYFYHFTRQECTYCKKLVLLYVLCETQEVDCNPFETGCCQNLDWEELLRGTPYVLVEGNPLFPWA